MIKVHPSRSTSGSTARSIRTLLYWCQGTFLASALLAVIALAHAASKYPEKPITLIIPYGINSDSQRFGEILTKYASAHFRDLSFHLENHVGDSGARAATEVRLMKGDGYTLFLGRVGSQVIAPALKPTLPYRASDFTFLGLVEIDPLVCAVRGDAPYRTHRDLTQAIREHPGILKFGHTGPGTIQNLGAQYLLRLAGLTPGSVQAVSYNGGPELVDALLAGQINFTCSNAASMVKMIQTGKLHALFTTAPGRMPELPSLQNAREVGFRDMSSMLGWSVLLGPIGLPTPVIERWKNVLQVLAKDPNWIAEMTALGAIPAIGTSKDNEIFIKEQSDFYDRLLPTLGLRE